MKITPVVLYALLNLSGCSLDHSHLNLRVLEWKSKTNAEIPPGRSLEEVKAWAVKNKLEFAYLEEKKQLYSTVERVPENGMNKYVCSEWIIVLKVNITASGTILNNEISKVGVCL